MQIEETIPEKVELSDIREFVINVNTKTIDVHMEDGKSFTADQQSFLNFWNNTMTQLQRNTIKGFIKQLAAIAASVDESKVTGDFGD